jgi:hypothetical protein
MMVDVDAPLQVSGGQPRHVSPLQAMPLIMLNGAQDLPTNEDGALNIIRQSGAPLDGDHLLLPVQSTEGREGQITHELTHQFEFEMIPSTPQIPAWVYEGLAEYERVRWTSAGPSVLPPSAMVPPVRDLTSADRSWGQAAFAFIGDEFGTEGIRRYLIALRSATANVPPTQQAFGLSADQFDQEFERYVRAQR